MRTYFACIGNVAAAFIIKASRAAFYRGESRIKISSNQIDFIAFNKAERVKEVQGM